VYEFVAIGPGIKQRWRRSIRPDTIICLGRAPRKGWAVPWDMRISREHAELTLQGDRLHVRRLATARNSIYVHGKPAENFTIGPREDFQIGKTVFRLTTPSENQSHQTGADRLEERREPAMASIASQPELQRLEAVLAQLDDEDSTRHEATPDAGTHRDTGNVSIGPAVANAFALDEYELVDQLCRCDAGQVLKVRHRYLQRWAAIQLLSS